MKRARIIPVAAVFALTVALAGTVAVFGQNAVMPSSMKTIGTPSSAAKPEIVPSLFVLNSRAATLQGDNLVRRFQSSNHIVALETA